MSFNLPDLPDYDQLMHELLHASMDHLIDLGARCNAHSDVLDADEDDDEDDQPSPIKVLKAQLHLNGAEDEVREVQQLIQVLTQLLITRHTRRVVHNDPPSLDDDGVDGCDPSPNPRRAYARSKASP